MLTCKPERKTILRGLTATIALTIFSCTSVGACEEQPSYSLSYSLQTYAGVLEAVAVADHQRIAKLSNLGGSAAQVTLAADAYSITFDDGFSTVVRSNSFPKLASEGIRQSSAPLINLTAPEVSAVRVVFDYRVTHVSKMSLQPDDFAVVTRRNGMRIIFERLIGIRGVIGCGPSASYSLNTSANTAPIVAAVLLNACPDRPKGEIEPPILVPIPTSTT